MLCRAARSIVNPNPVDGHVSECDHETRPNDAPGSACKREDPGLSFYADRRRWGRQCVPTGTIINLSALVRPVRAPQSRLNPTANRQRSGKLACYPITGYLVANNKMNGEVMVDYTPGQLRDAIGIGQETYRHWKKALAPLHREAGHSPCFTVGDLLATAIVKILVADYGIRVSALSALAASLFEACNTRSWLTLERSLLVLDVSGTRVHVQPECSGLTLDGPVIVVPLKMPIERLRGTLLAGDGDDQGMFRFPPTAQPTDPSRQRGGQS